MKISLIAVLSLMLLFSNQINAQEFGKSSYIDLAYQGGITASGQPYDGNQFTAAHKIHPFGTQLKVTRQDNGRSVIVRVNDRGPHIKGRIIDLSYAAAKSLDMIRDGVIDVKVEVIGKASTTTAKPAVAVPSTANSTTASPLETISPNDYQSNPGTTTTKGGTQEESTGNPKSTIPVTKNQGTDYGDRLLTKNYEKYGLYEIKILEVNKAGYGVQVASLSSYENAMKQLTRLQAKKIDNALLSVEQTSSGNMAFKVIIGPYESRDLAKKQEARLKRLLKVNGFIVDLGTISY